MMRAIVVIILSLVLTQNLIAGKSLKIKISGVIRSFDEKHVILDQDGYKYQTPRKFFSKGIRTGDKFTIEADYNEIFPSK